MAHHWKFFRAGGFDQARLDTAADLLAIGELDQKLWVALSCPVKGIEFDARTLALIDSDDDGQVRAPELIAAVQWAADRLVDPAVLGQGLPGVPRASIRADDEAGAAIAAAAGSLAADLGKGVDDLITVEEASAAQARFTARALAAWEAAGMAARPLGEATEAAQEALAAVAAKVDDYFIRCRLAAFDERAGPALNAADEDIKALAGTLLTDDAAGVAALPLAKVQAGGVVPLGSGGNPAWAAAIARLRDAAVIPFFGAREALTEADWQALKDRLAPHAAWLAARPDPAAEGAGVRELERLARYVRDLLPLANNFVAFKDFYTRQGKGTFQIGTLYLDGRSCELVVAVNDPAKHAALATLARVCLVYCDCRRGDATTSIAAAFTAGDADQLMVGRNGVFYDRQGRDWDATITQIIDHPISLRQSFWSPYKKFARLIGEQLQKIAAARVAGVEGNLSAMATGMSKTIGQPPTAPAAKPAATPFDVGKFAGIFAAIGLAVGALGTALASMLTGIVALKWWQMPLVLVALMLVVSGPAVILAWFKLRSRNLGPILDANGWAINARARINIPFGASLTRLAQLPPGSERALSDPYAEKETPWVGYFVIAVVVAAAWWWWFK